MTVRPSRTIAFPFRIGPHGGVAYVEDVQREHFQRILVALLTQPGERLMVPEFGTPTWAYLFENLDDSNAAEIAMRVQQALIRWVPEVVIHEVTPSLEALAEGELLLTVSFSVPPRQDVLTTTVDVGGALTGGTTRG